MAEGVEARKPAGAGRAGAAAKRGHGISQAPGVGRANSATVEQSAAAAGAWSAQRATLRRIASRYTLRGRARPARPAKRRFFL